jgi:hypothetical protein
MRSTWVRFRRGKYLHADAWVNVSFKVGHEWATWGPLYLTLKTYSSLSEHQNTLKGLLKYRLLGSMPEVWLRRVKVEPRIRCF